MDLYFKPIKRSTSRKQLTITPVSYNNRLIKIGSDLYQKSIVIDIISDFFNKNLVKNKVKDVESEVTYTDRNDYIKQLTTALDNRKEAYLVMSNYELNRFIKDILKGKYTSEEKNTKEKN
jgi:hypothetical protein